MTRPAGRGYLGFQIIGAFKLASGLLSLAVGFGLSRLFKEDVGQGLIHAISLLRLDPENHFIHAALSWASGLDRKHLRAIEAGTFFYAILHLIEGIGLLLRRRWAGYLTVIFTGSLIPLEGYELIKKVNAVRLAMLVVNVGIVLYLVWRLRKEERAEAERVAGPAAGP